MVLPLLATSEEEKAMMQDSPDDFARLAIDCSEGQFIKSSKVVACEYLAQMSESLDGACSLISRHGLSLLASREEKSLDLGILMLDIVHLDVHQRPDLLE